VPALRRRPLPKPEEIPWGELRRRSAIVFAYTHADAIAYSSAPMSTMRPRKPCLRSILAW